MFRKNDKNKHYVTQRNIGINQEQPPTIVVSCHAVTGKSGSLQTPTRHEHSHVSEVIRIAEDGCLLPHLCFQDVTQAPYLVTEGNI